MTLISSLNSPSSITNRFPSVLFAYASPAKTAVAVLSDFLTSGILAPPPTSRIARRLNGVRAVFSSVDMIADENSAESVVGGGNDGDKVMSYSKR